MKKKLLEPDKISGFFQEYRFLSNMFPSPFVFNEDVLGEDGKIIAEADGVTYPSVEHFYQTQKAHPDDLEEWRDHLLPLTPNKTKTKQKNGVLAPGVRLRDDWEAVKLDVMAAGVRMKFSHQSSSNMNTLLCKTRDKILVESNWWGDMFWGVNIINGEGENHLGKILMEVREEICSNPTADTFCYGVGDSEETWLSKEDAIEAYLDSIDDPSEIRNITIKPYKKKVMSDEDIAWHAESLLDDITESIDENYGWEDATDERTDRLKKAALEFIKIVREEYNPSPSLCEEAKDREDMHIGRDELIAKWEENK